MTSDGRYVRSYPIPANYLGDIHLDADGRLAVPTQGFREETVALTFDPDGSPIGRFGTPVVPPHEIWDMTTIKAEIENGGVPRQLRNMSRPALESDGSL